MGRCYEFGVAIAPACDHPMQVADAGGRCECATCGSGCDGRFTGCAAILVLPGYVPPGAPTRFPEPEPEVTPDPGTAEAPPDAEPEGSGAPADEGDRLATMADVRAVREDVLAWLAEIRIVLDEAIGELTTADPRAALQLVTLRRRLGKVGRVEYGPPPPD